MSAVRGGEAVAEIMDWGLVITDDGTIVVRIATMDFAESNKG